LTYDTQSIEKAKKYGVVLLHGDQIVACEEKPQKPQSTRVRTACEIWSPEVLDELVQWNERESLDKAGAYINHLINQGFSVISCPTEGEWIDIGDKEDLQKARTLWKSECVQEG